MKQTRSELNLLIILVVWGREYTRFFCEVVLPSLLWPGNLPAVAERTKARFLLQTTPEAARHLAEHRHFRKLRAIMDVETLPMTDDLTGKEKYPLVAACHRRALARVAEERAAFMLLSPDGVYADRSLGHAVDVVQKNGKRAVMLAGLRATKEEMEPALLARLDNARPMPPRELFGLAMSHLHPLSKANMVDSPTFNGWPSHLYWRAGNEGLLAHCFHLHPLLVWPRLHTWDCRQSMDGDYLERACPDPRDIHIIDDSDAALGLELSAAHQFDGAIWPNRFDPAGVAAWARENTNRQHWEFVRHKIYFRAGDSGKGFAAAEVKAKRTMEDVLRALAAS